MESGKSGKKRGVPPCRFSFPLFFRPRAMGKTYGFPLFVVFSLFSWKTTSFFHVFFTIPGLTDFRYSGRADFSCDENVTFLSKMWLFHQKTCFSVKNVFFHRFHWSPPDNIGVQIFCICNSCLLFRLQTQCEAGYFSCDLFSLLLVARSRLFPPCSGKWRFNKKRETALKISFRLFYR